MKTIIFIALIIVLGLFIAVGPLYIFRICDAYEMEDDELEVTCCGPSGFPRCLWTAQAEIGIGGLIIALGLCMLVFSDVKTVLGLALGVFFAAAAALAVPNFLIGGCPSSHDMSCYNIAFPALTVESILLLITSGILVFRSRKTTPE